MKLSKDEEGQVNDWTFTLLWAKSFALQTGSMSWDSKNNILFIGFDQGRLVRIKIDESNPMQHHELEELGVHTLRITGVLSNAEEGSFTSVSDDGTFKVTESSGQNLSEIKPS